MRIRKAATALTALAVICGTGSAPGAPGPVAAPSPAEPEAPEIRFDVLLPRLETALHAARSDAGFDPVALIEAEETAAVAEELLTEGEAGIAVELLEQAIALLPPPAPE